MRLVKYNQLEPQFPTTFSGMLDRFFNDTVNAAQRAFVPAVDIVEDEKSYEIHVAVPGVKKSDFKIDLTDGRLSISGERRSEEKKEGRNFHAIETQYGSFKRSFYVPEDVNTDAVEAGYEDGVLRLVLPKKEKKVTKSIIEVK
ncbi:MAG: heat-shock protein Hsp20 [Algoriphagus sp. 32-45-6]|jgi:HSP20 family protein|nr:MAG: heat-shock protein Hsp20 [Algoriphagus sp. 32-45-6]